MRMHPPEKSAVMCNVAACWRRSCGLAGDAPRRYLGVSAALRACLRSLFRSRARKGSVAFDSQETRGLRSLTVAARSVTLLFRHALRSGPRRNRDAFGPLAGVDAAWDWKSGFADWAVPPLELRLARSLSTRIIGRIAGWVGSARRAPSCRKS